ncbi:hypothetical protein Slin15195_G106690 [Septoria linicola]|uniref:Duf1665 domain containing protein n=1 Tax=Septoria linicola TaxID=215465 RepID=A0A9Q9AYA6_9PEZI|nr:hypothetical protein Slin14017_G069660 [Septoria linicola]USW57350.1 hypothetical protein Slin15195_G106690 [Septoria linicola]
MARRLHGVDCPLNAISDYSFSSTPSGGRPRFPNAINDWSGTPLTLRERKMMALMGELTDKPDWHKKIFDDKIVAKWGDEALALNADAAPEVALTGNAIDYCIEELRDYASKFEEIQMVPAINADGLIYKSDTRITSAMRDALEAAAAPLEDVEDSKKDWHPNSNEMVLDLVHPSLFPLLYGRSTVLPEGTVPLVDCESYVGRGDLVPVPKDEDLEVTHFPGLSGWDRYGNRTQHFYSKKYQWLPCEVAFKDNDKTEITSYINNLHPRLHKPLYESLQTIIAQVVPMWDACLSRSDLGHPPARDDADAEWIEPEGERPRAEGEDDMDEDDTWELDEDWTRENRTLTMPELENTYQTRADYERPSHLPTDDPTVDLRKDFATQGLQIIVKLANIHLTPEKPTYGGGSWHIEGQLNEHICASALYYYDSANITESYLSFRESTSVEHLSEKPYEQGDWEHIERVYGIEQNGPAIQNLGHVNTREGRLLAFPNVFQHRAEPFSLEDKTQPGHRKILALFLVDPYIRIPSTANVPPQQKEWWRGMLYGLDRVADLPPELAEGIVESAGDLPIDLEEAKKIRLELMEERKLFVEDVDTRFHQETFSFCEH